jgi:hypothetical protein
MGNRKMILTKQQINIVFHETQLEDNYNFLEDDLVKLANAFIEKAKPYIMKEELANCAEICNDLNPAVGNKLLHVRNLAIKELMDK